MSHERAFLSALIVLLAVSLPVYAWTERVDCNRGASLAHAIQRAIPGTTLTITGTCRGPIVINKAGLTIRGSNSATIDGQEKDAVTVSSVTGVTLANLEVLNGINGVVAKNGANVDLMNVAVQDNASIGVLLEGSSSATFSSSDNKSSSTSNNGLNGIDAEDSSAVILTGDFTSEGNAVFGINVNNASSLTFTQANVTVTSNILGIQIGTGAGAFISDSSTTITASNNLTTGLTIVSGGQMVAFGGRIVTKNNGIHGVSVDSKAGLDLDAAAVLTTSENAQDGVHLEETSVLTIFNTTAFSGAPGNTEVIAKDNGANGISLQTGSSVTVLHQAVITSTGNVGAGIFADNGSSVTLVKSSISGNSKNVDLTFGSRADITTSTIGNAGAIHCDATSLIRGDTATTCPTP